MISLLGVTNFVSGSSSSTTGHMNLPAGYAAGDLLIAVMGFEGVTPGSGPWAEYDPDPAHPDGEPDLRPAGWARILYEEPSTAGNGLEIWTAYYGGGTFSHFKLATSGPFAAQMIELRGIYLPASPTTTNPVAAGTIRANAEAQVTGDNPACPSVAARQGDMILGLAAHQLQSPGFGTPTSPAGYTTVFDNPRAGTFGDVEIAAAVALAATSGTQGPIDFSALAATGSTKGATATLAIRPAGPSIISTRFPAAIAGP